MSNDPLFSVSKSTSRRLAPSLRSHAPQTPMVGLAPPPAARSKMHRHNHNTPSLSHALLLQGSQVKKLSLVSIWFVCVCGWVFVSCAQFSALFAVSSSSLLESVWFFVFSSFFLLFFESLMNLSSWH